MTEVGAATVIGGLIQESNNSGAGPFYSTAGRLIDLCFHKPEALNKDLYGVINTYIGTGTSKRDSEEPTMISCSVYIYEKKENKEQLSSIGQLHYLIPKFREFDKETFFYYVDNETRSNSIAEFFYCLKSEYETFGQYDILIEDFTVDVSKRKKGYGKDILLWLSYLYEDTNIIGLSHDYKKSWLHQFYKQALPFEDVLIDEPHGLMLKNRIFIR